jgi:hypothetical protein
MKNYLPLLALLIVVSIAACHKSGSNGPKTLTGTWYIVSDSSHSDIGPTEASYTRKYTGQPSDHYILTGNLVYIRDSTKLDTANYVVSHDTLQLLYTYNGQTVKGLQYLVTMPDANSLELSYTLNTPGGVLQDYIKLKR